MTNNTDRKQELMNKIYKLWVSNVKDNDVDLDTGNFNLLVAGIEQSIMMSNIGELKEFLIDRNCRGEKPHLIISSPVKNPQTRMMQDRFYMPRESKYNQDILDYLKGEKWIPEDSTTANYDFLLRNATDDYNYLLEKSKK